MIYSYFLNLLVKIRLFNAVKEPGGGGEGAGEGQGDGDEARGLIIGSPARNAFVEAFPHAQ
jgi:hypothetical protein